MVVQVQDGHEIKRKRVVHSYQTMKREQTHQALECEGFISQSKSPETMGMFYSHTRKVILTTEQNLCLSEHHHHYFT